MTETRLDRQINFITEIDRLKSISRRSCLIGGERVENSAEHSWHVVVLAMVLAEYANESIDLLCVMKMLAVHDLVEIDAGDTFCYDEQGTLDKADRESQAAERIFGLLPDEQGDELLDLWREFEERTTPEAKFANAMDRLMPLLHNYHAQGRPWKENDVRSDRVFARCSPIGDGASELWAYAHSVIEDAIGKGYLAEREGV